METQIRSIINDVFYDLEQACISFGEQLDAQTLADCVGDRMCDTSEEYRAMPYEQRRAILLKICQQYA